MRYSRFALVGLLALSSCGPAKIASREAPPNFDLFILVYRPSPMNERYMFKLEVNAARQCKTLHSLRPPVAPVRFERVISKSEADELFCLSSACLQVQRTPDHNLSEYEESDLYEITVRANTPTDFMRRKVTLANLKEVPAFRELVERTAKLCLQAANDASQP
jgi:hypothetical protein